MQDFILLAVLGLILNTALQFLWLSVRKNPTIKRDLWRNELWREASGLMEPVMAPGPMSEMTARPRANRSGGMTRVGGLVMVSASRCSPGHLGQFTSSLCRRPQHTSAEGMKHQLKWRLFNKDGWDWRRARFSTDFRATGEEEHFRFRVHFLICSGFKLNRGLSTAPTPPHPFN